MEGAVRRSAFAPWRPEDEPRVVKSAFRPLPEATLGLRALYLRCNPEFRFFQSVPRRCLTKPSQGVHNNDYDNQHHDYILYVNDTLNDDHGNQFAVLDLLGTGTFGQVVKCRHQQTGDIVAVKVIKNQPAYFNQAWVEINILRMLHRNNGADDTKHIVKFYSHFVFREHLCLVFERLSINLYELLKQNNYVGVSLEMLRNFLSQILQALHVLVRSEVIHCDLKPENILLKALDTAELKIIDFGSACQLHYPVYSYVQSRFYRSPEVLLGWPEYDSKIDMWSLGCVAGELFLGIPLFPGQNEMNMVCRIAEMLGDMPDRFLRRCRHTNKFFNTPTGEFAEGMHIFQLKSVSQYERENNVNLPEWKRFFKEKKLRDIVTTYPHRTPAPHTVEIQLRESLIDLLHGMLRIDPRERWTPAEALQHPFIKGETLPGGQPWVPPSRPRRVMRSRAVVIEPSADGDHNPVDGYYSASAPNFNGRGRLSMNATWGATGQPAAKVLVNPPYQSHPFGAAAYSFGDSEGPLGGPAFAPGSYAPPSTLGTYGMMGSVPGPPQHSRRGPGLVAPGSYGHDARGLMYQPHSSFDSMQHGGPAESPSGVMGRTDTPPLPHTAALRLGNALHVSGSRESLTGSLRMSASRESLGMARVPSVGEMAEDPMFAFGSDDEGLSPAGLPPKQPMHTGSVGSSAALPPPGPRLPQSRSGMYGSPSNSSSRDHAFTRAGNRSPSVQANSVDTLMGEAQDGHRHVRDNGNFGAFASTTDGRVSVQDEASPRECLSRHRHQQRGT